MATRHAFLLDAGFELVRCIYFFLFLVVTVVFDVCISKSL